MAGQDIYPAPEVFNEPGSAGRLGQIVAARIDAKRVLVVGDDDLYRLADEAMKVTRLLENNARLMSPSGAFDIYRAAL